MEDRRDMIVTSKLLVFEYEIRNSYSNNKIISMLLLYMQIWFTRRSGHYAPILLAPAEGWGPFGPLGAMWAGLADFGPQ